MQEVGGQGDAGGRWAQEKQEVGTELDAGGGGQEETGGGEAKEIQQIRRYKG